MPGINEPLLINILGHAAGALIFAIFLGLLFSGRGWSGDRGRNLSGLAAARGVRLESGLAGGAGASGVTGAGLSFVDRVELFHAQPAARDPAPLSVGAVTGPWRFAATY